MSHVWPILRLRRRDLQLDEVLRPLTPGVTPPRSSEAPEPVAPAERRPINVAQPPSVIKEPEAALATDPAQEVPAVGASDDIPPSSPASQAFRSPELQPTEGQESLINGSEEVASPVPAPDAQAPDTHALAEMTGFFRAIAHRKINAPECGQGPGGLAACAT